MIEHLQAHFAGLVHVLTAIAAMIVGAVVLLRRKGTRSHRWMGRGYIVMMLIMYATAMTNYELFGRFGPFHWLVLASFVTVAGGYLAAWRRRPGWRIRHAYFMAGSWVGLMAAAVAETATRIPGWPFGPTVLVSSTIVIVVGVWLMLRMIPRALGRVPN